RWSLKNPKVFNTLAFTMGPRCYSYFHVTVSFSRNCSRKPLFSRTYQNAQFAANSPQFASSNSQNASETRRRSIARHYDVIRPWLKAGHGRGAHTLLGAGSQEDQKDSLHNECPS